MRLLAGIALSLVSAQAVSAQDPAWRMPVLHGIRLEHARLMRSEPAKRAGLRVVENLSAARSGWTRLLR